MVKKRFKLAIILVITLFSILAAAAIVQAGCCIGVTGCSRAFMDVECPTGISTFSPNECEDEQECNVVACCHDVAGIPIATYRSTCQAMSPVPGMTDIGPFMTDPSIRETYARSLCTGAAPNCQYTTCDGENTVGCKCGSSVTSTDNPYCCGLDSAVFGTFPDCSASLSCQVRAFYNVEGTIVTPSGQPVAGATVRAGGKQSITDENGAFQITQLPDNSAGSIVAIKNNSINSTTYNIASADVTGIRLVLRVSALPVEGAEICDNGFDDDGDQFNWNSSLLEDAEHSLAADWCDSDCHVKGSTTLKVDKSVSRTYYRYSNEWASQEEDFCSDNIDNDCDGYTDCEDPECKDNSPACQPTFCGDGAVQFPNAFGEFEQCDMNVSTGLGDDSLCPGKCIPAGEPNQCHCMYEAVCGNGVIDEPLEDCDGSFVASDNMWDPENYNTGSDCTLDFCGLPNSPTPCQCPPPQICGNGIKEEPEQCDAGGLPGAKSPADRECPEDGQCSPNCQCPPAPIVCGNNLIEYGEDCDGEYEPLTNTWTNFKTRKYGCTHETCAPPLDKYLTLQDGTEIQGRSETTYDDLLAQIGADGPCQCATVCKLQPTGPNLSAPTPVQYEREIDLSWDDECAKGSDPNIKTYNVLRCEAQDINGQDCDSDTGTWTVVNEEPLGVAQEYADVNFKGSTADDPRYYCYRVEGIYETLTLETRSVKSNYNPEIHCIEAGREECFTFRDFFPNADEFCSANVRSMCNFNNSIVKVEDTKKVDCNVDDEISGIPQDYVCVGPYSEGADEGKTKCVPKSACDYCQDPFGLFAYSRSPGTNKAEMEYVPGFVGDYGMAPYEAQVDSPRPNGWLPCFALDFCYMDRSYTSVDMFHARKSNMTCYDYRSKEACLSDKMQIQNCEWAPHPKYGELGIGVCRTTIVADQQCEKCHDPLNKVFGKCDRDMCELYGRCYYDRNNLLDEYLEFYNDAFVTAENPVRTADFGGDNYYYKCRPEKEISCANYDSREDCEDSASAYSRDGSKQVNFSVDIDVDGNMVGDWFNKSNGTNTLVEGSDDYFNFSKCAWVYDEYITHQADFFDPSNITTTHFKSNQRCIKNSDDSPPQNISKEFPNLNTTDLRRSSDCTDISTEIVPDERDCRKDITPPLTTLPLYDEIRIAGNFELLATVNDDSLTYSSYNYYPTTYACLAEDKEGVDCYPNGAAFGLGRESGNLITLENANIEVSYNRSEINATDTPSQMASGWYIFKYFSEDLSKNIEPVKEYRVFLDADAPNIQLSLSNTSWEDRPDVWLTNLSLGVDVVPRYELDDKFAFCNAKMYLGNYSIFPLQDIMNEYNNTWNRFYDRLFDDYYTFWYRCADDVGNVAEDWVEIIIDGDRSLTNPKPRGTVATNEVALQIETGTNAECRYMESTSPIPALENGSAIDDDLFSSMTKFDFTGTPEKPTNVHQSIVTLPHGYHRLYVKCYMFADESYRGNNADQIRFAVDNDAPTTDWSTNVPAYNNWYNSDILVKLTCDDPVIYGQGTQWQFGCDRTYYCNGLDCASQDKWKLYTTDIPLYQSTYLSFYSLDQGNNIEDVKENVLFQIDKEPAEVEVEITEGSSEADVVVLDNLYTVTLKSDKPLISPLVESPQLQFHTEPQKLAGRVELLPTENASIWQGSFRLDDINANRDFEGVLTFEATGHDNHRVGFFVSKDIRIDTKPPNMPIIEPSLELPSPDASEYQLMPYPVHWVDGTYYTNQRFLKVTGYTDELLDVIGVSTTDNIDVQIPYTQGNFSAYLIEQNATPGCCIGPTGCSRAATGDLCPPLSSFVRDKTCEEDARCDIVACCHNQTGIPQATYRAVCDNIDPTPTMSRISEFNAFPYSKATEAAVQCGQAFVCSYSNCEDANNLACACGSSTSSSSDPYCCGLDSGVFASKESCQASPSCVPKEEDTAAVEHVETFKYQDKVISGFEGGREIRIAGDIRNLVTTEDYIGLDSEQTTIGPRREYGSYGLFYDITSMKYHGGDERYTSIFTYQPLIATLSSGQDVFFYDQESPEFWFGLDVVLSPLKNTTFYLKAYDSALNLVRYPPITSSPYVLTFFYDPFPPKVISHLPIDGSTARNTFNFSLEMLEGSQESGIDFNNTQFLINGNPVEFDWVVDDSSDPILYKVIHPVKNLEDGIYEVEVIAPDLATNALDESTASASWTVKVDHSLPYDPFLYFRGCNKGIGDDMGWYCKTAPKFDIDFTLESEPVTIRDTIMKSTPTAGDAATCDMTADNIFNCTFNDPKGTELPEFWTDYGLIVVAYKTLTDGSISKDGNYGPYPFTVDSIAPKYNVSVPARIRDNYNLSIPALVTNENHPLKATFSFLGTDYEVYSSSSGTMYNFNWQVPDFSKAAGDEGEHPLTITVSDLAGNSKTLTVDTFLDLTPPSISDLNINISNTKWIANEPFTANPNVTISGTLADTDIEAIWVVPGDFNETTQDFNDKEYGYVYMEDGVMKFDIDVRLYDPSAGGPLEPFMYNEMLISQINDMMIYVQDQAGHVSAKPLRVYRDVAPPLTPKFTITSGSPT